MSPPDDGDESPSDSPPSEPSGGTPPGGDVGGPDRSPAGAAGPDRRESRTVDVNGKRRDRPVGLEGGTDDVDETADWARFAYDVANSVVAVLLVGALLFAVSGVWPPMVAVESPSMTPHMKTGDLVFVMEETRFPGEGARAGVVTARVGRTTDVDYRKFRRQGDVIVYKPNGNGESTPIIHRAMFWVNESENWYDKADRQAVGRYDECGDSPGEALPACPAPHAGFITKGDANARYDQVDGLSGPVRPAWVVGTAEVRIPLLGCLRLRSDRCANRPLGTVGPAAGL